MSTFLMFNFGEAIYLFIKLIALCDEWCDVLLSQEDSTQFLIL